MKISGLMGLLFPAILLAGNGQYMHEAVNGENCRTCHFGQYVGVACHLGTGESGCGYCHHWTEDGETQTIVSIPVNADCTECHRDSEQYRVNAAHETSACTACHSPHGSDLDYLLRDFANTLCTSNCHLPDELGRSHPRGLGTLDIHTGDMVTCISTCHRIHAPNSEKLLSISPPYLCTSCHADKL